MRDKTDKQTLDIFTLNKPVGRPRKYISNAVKQRVYRQRKKLINSPQEAQVHVNSN